MAETVAIGLHVTKCAGAALASHAQAKLRPDAVYICSSFLTNTSAADEQLVERLSLDGVKLVFGHYIHESLLKMFEGRPMFWFTGVREPGERAVSQYYQLCRAHANAGKPLPSASEFLVNRDNGMCREFMRAFPTIENKVRGSLADKAIAAAEMFDFIYGMDDFEASAAAILSQIGLGAETVSGANRRDWSPEDEKLVSGQAEIILASVPDHFDQDALLYQYLAPHLGKLHPFRVSDYETRSSRQLQWIPEIVKRSAGIDDFIDHIGSALVFEFLDLGMGKDLADQFARKARLVDHVTSLLEWRLNEG